MKSDPCDTPTDPQQGLQQRWRRFCERLGLQDDGTAMWDRLIALYGQPWRKYHNLSHIKYCLATLDSQADSGSDHLDVEAAIWYHDAVYEVGASDNERQSAQLARESLAVLGADGAFAERVAEFIIATDHKQAAPDCGAQLLCDIDLSILGRDASTYDQYAEAIFREVALPEQAFALPRHAFLGTMLEKEKIFQTQSFEQEYDAQARRNMRRERERWGKFLPT